MSRFIHYILVLLFATSAQAANTETVHYKRAFTSIEAGKPQQAEALAAKGKDPILNKVVRGYAMGLPGNDYDFIQLNAFIEANPNWPGIKDIRMIAEQKIPSSYSPEQAANWFAKHPPITMIGFYKYIDALDLLGRTQKALAAIKDRWIEDSMTADEQAAFMARFRHLIDQRAMWARTDSLLWKNSVIEARRMMPYLDSTDKALAEARIAISTQQGTPENWLPRVPSDAQNDPGLVYQMLRFNVKNDRDIDAKDILLRLPADLPHAESWWEQRQIIARRAIEQRNFVLAYNLSSNHGDLEPKFGAQAEFLSGWLALRFLKRPDIALIHFQKLQNLASTPITKSRGAYWLGRTYEALGNQGEAKQSYEEAAVFQTTYYGQLASARIYSPSVLTIKSDPPLPESARRSFLARDHIKAIEKLKAIGDTEKADVFFNAALNGASMRSDFVMLSEVAAKMHRPDLGIQTVKTAGQKGFFIENGGFPIMAMHLSAPPEPAFVHALIRQESMFNPNALSPVGARGLMQLMPGTAREVAKKIGLPYQPSRLSDQKYNIQLGTTFVQQQIDRFNGSYVLALAGYNAGPRRVRTWIEEFGDPRSPEIDPVDWIELIPVPETRNYVQRILESLQVYRSKLAGGKSRLGILSDLKR